MNACRPPLAVFAFNRPRHLRDCLDALAKCTGIEQCEVRIYCDGSRGQEDDQAVRETRVIAQEWAKTNGAVIEERQQNAGLARSIIEAVTALCAERGRVIVVEDDLVVSKQFVQFMLDGLEHFRDRPEVYQIAGYMFRVQHPPRPESFFLPMVTTWGWATWQRAWKDVDWTASGALAQLQDKRLSRTFDLGGSYPYALALSDRLAGRNQSWGILWWWHVFSRDGLSLFPARTLVANKGFDGTGYHCPDGDWRGADQIMEYMAPVRLPASVQVDRQAFRRVTRFIRINNASKKAFFLHRLWWGFVAVIKGKKA